MGPGVAFIDYDNDGWQDILLVNGMDWPGHARKHSTLALYHNNHDGTFTDVTKKAGLAVEMYGMGVAIGDYDNDGFDDIFITALGQNHLFHNNGNGTFTDVTKRAGLEGPQRIQHQRRVGGLRPRREARFGGRELRAVVAAKPTSTARSTEKRNRTARRRRTRARRCGFGTIAATAHSKM